LTPVVDVQGMYPGGSDGAFDLWEAQGWVRSDKSHKRRASDHLETPPRYLPCQFAIDPPSYDDCDAAPLITATHPTPSHDKLVLPTASALSGWSGVEWGLTPWTPWSGSKRGTQIVSVLEVYRQGKPCNSVNMNSLFVVYVSVPRSYKDLR
jgi:hypothetical protein